MESTGDILFSAMRKFKKIHALYLPDKLNGLEFFILQNITFLRDKPSPEEIYVSDLIADSHMTMPAISQALSLLEGKGYITRQVSVKDRRKVAVSITLEGVMILKNSKRKIKESFDEIIKRFGKDEFEALMDLLERLDGVLSEMQEEKS